jgi:hypothetical protein
MSLTGFHPVWDIFSHKIYSKATDQGCHVEASTPSKGTAYREWKCIGIFQQATLLHICYLVTNMSFTKAYTAIP